MGAIKNPIFTQSSKGYLSATNVPSLLFSRLGLITHTTKPCLSGLHSRIRNAACCVKGALFVEDFEESFVGWICDAGEWVWSDLAREQTRSPLRLVSKPMSNFAATMHDIPLAALDCDA